MNVDGDDMRRLVELLRFHQGETVDAEQLAQEAGLDWATTYNSLQLIDDIGALAPETVTSNGDVTVGHPRHETPDLFESEKMQVLSYIFARTKSDNPLPLDEHSYLDARDAGIKAAVDDGFVEHSDGEVALTPEGLGKIGPLYSERLHNRNSSPDTFPVTCPHCQSDLTDEWMDFTARWDGKGTYESTVTCPECGQDASNPPETIGEVVSETNVPPTPETTVSFETFDLLQEQFDLEPSLWTSVSGVDGPITNLPNDDTATWSIYDAHDDERTMMAKGTLPLEATIEGVEVTLTRSGSGVDLTVNGDTTVALTSPEQLPLTVFDRIHVRRED